MRWWWYNQLTGRQEIQGKIELWRRCKTGWPDMDGSPLDDPTKWKTSPTWVCQRWLGLVCIKVKVSNKITFQLWRYLWPPSWPQAFQTQRPDTGLPVLLFLVRILIPSTLHCHLTDSSFYPSLTQKRRFAWTASASHLCTCSASQGVSRLSCWQPWPLRLLPPGLPEAHCHLLLVQCVHHSYCSMLSR